MAFKGIVEMIHNKDNELERMASHFYHEIGELSEGIKFSEIIEEIDLDMDRIAYKLSNESWKKGNDLNLKTIDRCYSIILNEKTLQLDHSGDNKTIRLVNFYGKELSLYYNKLSNQILKKMSESEKLPF